MTARFLGFVLGFVLLFVARGARGETETGLPVVITVGSSGFDAAKIEEAIQNELGVPLRVDPTAEERLEVVVTGRQANVTYFRKSGEPVTRSVDLPKDDERAFETLAFLAGNLARDEASELLRTLTPLPKEAEPEPPPPPPAPPPPPPPAKAAPKPAPKPDALIEPKTFAFNISVLYPRALLPQTERRRLNLEVGLLSSRIGALNGIAGSFGYQRIDGQTDGIALAIGWNRTGPVSGIESAIFVSEGYGLVKGVSYANIANVRDGDVEGAVGSALAVKANHVAGIEGAGIFAMAHGVRGAQGSGIMSYTSGNVVGFQGAGIGALTLGDMTGGALAGIATSARDVTGIQLAGIANFGRTIDGAQMSGLFNGAGDVTGGQLAVVNVGRRVNGVQIGVVNVSDELNGGAIGLVNVAGNGRIQPSVWFAGPDFMGNAGVKFVAGNTYTLLGAGYNASGDRFAYEGSAGVHLGVGAGFVEGGVGAASTRNTVEDFRVIRSEARLESRVGYEVMPWVTPYVGGALTYRLEGEGRDFRGHYFFGLAAL